MIKRAGVVRYHMFVAAPSLLGYKIKILLLWRHDVDVVLMLFCDDDGTPLSGKFKSHEVRT
jgi:hypothetical protein